MADPKPAATVVVLRDGADGLEVLMLRRSHRAGFFPHAWVFPGGRVDDADADTPFIGSVEGLDASDAMFAVAAVRECFEEAGVWLGTGVPEPGLRDALNARSGTLLQTSGLSADLDRLEHWAWWVTPPEEPKRYDARFFVTALGPDELSAAVPDHRETVASAWISPRGALDSHASGDFFLAPPTFRTLEELCAFDRASTAVDAGRVRPVVRILPRLEVNDDGVCIVLPGDPAHPSEFPAPGRSRIQMRDGRWHSEGALIGAGCAL